jgi:IS4 transposase
VFLAQHAADALDDLVHALDLVDLELDRKRRNGQRVRVIEYELVDSARETESRYRLITTLLDPADAPADELAALYHERWEVESVFDELKVHLGGGPGYSTMLRSKTPKLVQQEFWGMLLAHFGVRQLMQEAARAQRIDPDRLSFSHAVRVIKRKLPQAAALPP